LNAIEVGRTLASFRPEVNSLPPFALLHVLLCDRFPAEENLRHYHGSVAVLVAGEDTVVPEKFGRRLYDSYTGPKRLWDFPECDHGTVMRQSPELWKQIIAFWERR
jgi:hypothetical protein